MPTRPDGDLLTVLAPEQRNDYLAGRGSVAPRLGTTVRLWRLPGTWSIWSAGPAVGTWWLRAVDDEARHIIGPLTAAPVRGAPVVRAIWKDCVAVASRDIKLAGRA